MAVLVLVAYNQTRQVEAMSNQLTEVAQLIEKRNSVD